MKIFITGISGFIGYHLARKLFSQGHHVLGIDSYNSYYDVALKRARSGKLDELGIENSYDDLSVLAFKPHWFNKLEDVDVVIHLAAYAGVRYSLDHPKLYMDNNIIATQNLISACEKHKVNTVFYASTSCIMANNPLPWNEDEKLGHQSNPYAISKAANESQFKCSKIPINVGLRFFTVYGPWGRPDMALFDFTKNIIAGNPIQLFNNGDMVRDFTYVDDIINGINILLQTSQKTPEKLEDIYCIGRGEKVMLMDFVDEIEKNLDRKAIRELVPMHPADTHITWSDTTKLQKLGYDPKVSIAEGVEKFVSWYKDYYKIN